MESIGCGKEILVVDDTAAVQEFLSIALERDGFAVSVASDVGTALDRLRERLYDIVLTDKNLPDGTGLDIARYVAKYQPNCDVILITADSDVSSAVEAMRIGVTDYIEKPISLSFLHQRLRRIIRLRSLSDENRSLIAELKVKNRELSTAIRLDSLTGLFNRAYFEDAIARELRGSFGPNNRLAVLFIDVDRFKSINDTFGHAMGDRLLTALGRILKGGDSRFRLRARDVAARFGGDEFAILLPETSKSYAKEIAERLRSAVEAQSFGAQSFPKTTLSIGIAGYPEDARDQAGILAAADSALYTAKHMGRNRVVAYSDAVVAVDSDQQNSLSGKFRLIAALETSIKDNLFDFDCRPILCASSGRVYANDVVARPRHPSFPDTSALVRVAEGAGRIAELCRRLREGSLHMRASDSGESRLFLNLHAHELEDPQFGQSESDLIARSASVVLVLRLSPAHDLGRVRDGLARLRAMGYEVALENLAFNYSALNAIALCGPSFVKLGAEQLRSAERDPRGARFLRHLVEFATEEKINLIAEGIDTPEQYRLVTSLGCPLLQGDFFDGRESVTPFC